MTHSDILHLLHQRHSCKEFDPSKKINPEDFDVILEAGRLSPNSFGIEPWKFLVIQDLALREKIYQNSWGAKKQLPTCSHYVLILARTAHFMRYDSEYVTHYMRDVQKSPDDILVARLEKYANFQESDFGLTENDRYMFDWASKQTYIALANMMTTATMMGIDSCAVEGYNIEKMNEVLQHDLNINITQFGLSVMVAFGYSALPVRPKVRLPKQEVIQWF